MLKRATFVVSFVFLLALGFQYAWSIFLVPIEADTGWLRSELSLAYSISATVTMVSGFVVSSYTRRHPEMQLKVLAAAGPLILAGFVCVAMAQSVIQLYLAYGVVLGVVFGIPYFIVIMRVPALFSGNQGLVTGTLQMGMGFGGLVVGTLSSMALEVLGWREVFVAIGAAICVLSVLVSLMISRCCAGEGASRASGGAAAAPAAADGPARRLPSALYQPVFWFCAAWCFCLGAAGMNITSHIAPLAESFGAAAALAVAASGFASAGNGLGRIVFGGIVDRCGLDRALRFEMAVFAAATACVVVGAFAGLVPVFLAGTTLLCLAYGSGPTTIALMAQRLTPGSGSAQTMSLLMMISVTPCSYAGPLLTATLYTMTGSYVPLVIEIVVLLAAALPFGLMLVRRVHPQPLSRAH